MQPGCAWPRQSKTSSGQYAAVLSTELQETWRPRHFPSHCLLPWQVATLPAAGQGLGKEDKAVQPGPVLPSGAWKGTPPLHGALQAPRKSMLPFPILILQSLNSHYEAHTSLAPSVISYTPSPKVFHTPM